MVYFGPNMGPVTKSSWFEKVVQRDAEVSHALRLDPGQKVLWKAASFLAHSGDSWFWVMALGVIWLLDWGEWHSRAAFFAAAIVIQALLVFALKFLIRRQRPAGEWGSVYRNSDPHSFPSGHATRAGLLVMLSVGLGPAWLAMVILLWAPVMSLARVIMGVHYLSDVLAGFVFGLVVGWVFITLAPQIISAFPILFSPTFWNFLF